MIRQLLLMLLAASQLAHAQAQVERIAQAPVDEWFYGVADPRNRWLPDADIGKEMAVPSDAIAKRNGGYVWAMTSTSDNLWFSTLSNGWCGWMMVTGQFLPTRNSRWACETFRSSYPDNAEVDVRLPWPDGATIVQADWRRPSINRHNTTTGEFFRVESEHPTFQAIMARSFGFRAAGSADGVVFMASNPLVRSDKSVYLLAFNGESGEFIDGVKLANYINVRRFRTVTHADGSQAMYVFVGSEMHSSAHPNHLLRWVGSPETPFKGAGNDTGFEVVGDLGSAGSGVELIEFEGRFVLTTWGSETLPAGLYQTSPFPDGGFTPEQPASFGKIFDAADFDPDPVIARSWLIGALEEFNGYIYWGAMFPNGQGFQQLVMDSPGLLFAAREAIIKAHRSTHLFRTDLRDENKPKTELLYGKEKLWAYNGQWTEQTNLLGVRPLFGDAGFGAFFNDYTWTMVKYRGSLYLGTFDVSGGMLAIRDETDCQLSCFVLRTLSEHATLSKEVPGFDLYRFDSTDRPAVAVTLDGFGNPANNGVRNAMVVGDDLYIGSSTYSNIDAEQGGWELFKLTAPSFKEMAE